MAWRDTAPTLKINLSKRLLREEDEDEGLQHDRDQTLPISMVKKEPISTMHWQKSWLPALSSTKV
eukprot:9148419-Pyramimonas_sp.AAC.1